jgi:hypothetical protein
MGEFACETDMWRAQGRKGQPYPRETDWQDGIGNGDDHCSSGTTAALTDTD